MSNTAIVIWNAFVAVSFSTKVFLGVFLLLALAMFLIFAAKIICKFFEVAPDFFCVQFFKILAREMLPGRKEVSKAARADRFVALLTFGMVCIVLLMSISARMRTTELMIVVGGMGITFFAVVIMSVWIVSKEDVHIREGRTLDIVP